MLEKRFSFSAACVLLAALSLSCCGCVAQDEISEEAELIFDTAKNLQNDKQFDLAEETWADFVKKFPKTSLTNKARYNLARCQAENKKYGEAIGSFEKTIQNATNDPDFAFLDQTYLWLGFCHYSEGRANEDPEKKNSHFSKAIQTYDKMCKTFPDGKFTDQALYFKGQAEYFNGDLKSSIATQQELIDGFEESALRENAFYNVAVTHSELGEYTTALEKYDDYLNEFPEGKRVDQIRLDRPAAQIDLALEAENAQEFDTASQLYKSAETELGKLAADPNFADRDEAMYKQAFAILRQGRDEDAANLFAKVVADYPDSTRVPEAMISAGRYFFNAKNYDESQKWLTEVEKLDNQFLLEANHWLCKIGLAKSEFENVLERAEKILPAAAESPWRVNLLMDAGDALYGIPERRKESIGYYAKIINEHANENLAPQALYNVAYTSLIVKDYETAIKHSREFETKFASNEFYPDIREIIGESQFKLEQYDEAEATILDNISQFQNHPKTGRWQNRIGLIRFLKDDLDGVISWLQPKVDSFADSADKAEALFRIGATHFRRENFAKSKKALDDSLAADSTWRFADEATILLGRTQYELAELDDAISTLSGFATQFPNSARMEDAAYRLGEVYLEQEDLTKAREQYLKISNDNQELLPFALYGLAWTDVKESKFDDAEKNFSALIEGYENHELIDDAMLGRGLCRRRAGEIDKAIADFDQFINSTSDPAQKESAMYEKGLAFADDKNWPEAVKAFKAVIRENAETQLADKVHYELAWALKKSDQPKDALDSFQILVDRFSDSPLAAEANFHVAQSHYNAKEYEKAVDGFRFCEENTIKESLREMALFSLGRTYFFMKDYDQSKKNFEKQLDVFPKGDLAADALSMIGESLYKSEDHALAVKAYKVAVEEIPNSPTATPGIELVSRLHGAQSANLAKDYQAALDFATPIVEENADWEFAAEAWYEIGAAHLGQKNEEKAVEAWERVIGKNNQTGARARFMIGEVLFGQQKFDEAIRNFKLVIYGYGGDDANDDVKKWQASSAYEAARCNFVRISEASDTATKNKLIEDAKAMFEIVVNKHSQSEYVDDAKASLAKLKNLK